MAVVFDGCGCPLARQRGPLFGFRFSGRRQPEGLGQMPCCFVQRQFMDRCPKIQNTPWAPQFALKREGQANEKDKREGQACDGSNAAGRDQRKLSNHKEKREGDVTFKRNGDGFRQRRLGYSGELRDLDLDGRTGIVYIANTHTPGDAFDDDCSFSTH